MAIYTTFFLAAPKQLPAAFPGWKLPLSAPVTRTFVDPFTREERKIESRSPEWEDFDSENIEFPESQVVAIEGDYQSYLESRTPPFVQSQPHWCAKGLTHLEMEPLIAVATGIPDPKLVSALYAHPATGCGLELIPDAFIQHLKLADAAELQSIATKWAAAMSTPEHTQSMSGIRLMDDWTAADGLTVVDPIAQLAREHADDQSLYLLIES